MVACIFLSIEYMDSHPVSLCFLCWSSFVRMNGVTHIIKSLECLLTTQKTPSFIRVTLARLYPPNVQIRCPESYFGVMSFKMNLEAIRHKVRLWRSIWEEVNASQVCDLNIGHNTRQSIVKQYIYIFFFYEVQSENGSRSQSFLLPKEWIMAQEFCIIN